MKWLYRILRLFFCPHKFEAYKTGTTKYNGNAVSETFITRCKYCGKLQSNTFKASLL